MLDTFEKSSDKGDCTGLHTRTEGKELSIVCIYVVYLPLGGKARSSSTAPSPSSSRNKIKRKSYKGVLLFFVFRQIGLFEEILS